MEFELWWLLFLPVFFALGWAAVANAPSPPLICGGRFADQLLQSSSSNVLIALPNAERVFTIRNTRCVQLSLILRDFSVVIRCRH